MNEELEIVSLMRAETALAEPPSGIVDLERAMTAGRRQRWYGRAAGAVLVAAILVAGVVAVPQVLSAGGPPGYQFAVPRDIPALPTLGVSAAPSVFDPSVAYLRFGWAPEDYHERGYQVGLGPDGQIVTLQATPRIAYDWQGVSVSLYPRGVTPPPPQRNDGQAGAKVLHTALASGGDQDATWTAYTGASGQEVFLSWRYAPQGWARVRVAQAAGDASAVALHVAQTLRLSGGDRLSLSLPFRVGPLPGGLRPVQTVVGNSTAPENQPWYVGTSFSSAPAGQRIEQALTVSVTPYRHQDTTGGKGYNPPNATIDGHPANQAPPSGPTSNVTVYDVAGVNVQVEIGDPNLVTQLGPQGCRSVYEKVALSAGAAAWTTGLQD
jgi:hypothetical protein